MLLLYRLIGAFGLGVFLAGGLPAMGSDKGAADEVAADEKKNLLEVLEEDGEFTMFLRAVAETDLQEKFTEKGPYTVFAPSDEAFDLLPSEVLDLLMSPGQQYFRTRLLSHHVLADSVTSSDNRGEGEQSVETIAGTRLAVISEGDLFYVEAAEVKARDMEASNGMVHRIDRILVPGN